tara:strand:+ start:122 stop:643 length:522 start_codon:yes stop_codon:yes gene_type:complete
MSSELRVDRIIPTAGIPTGGGGSIIQVVSTTKTDTFSTSSSSFTDITGLSASITPKFSTSKILVLTHVTGNGNGSTRVNFRLMRDSTAICIGDTNGSRCRTFGGIFAPNNDNTTETVSAVHLDSPATSSAVTYKVQVTNQSGNAVYVNRSDSYTEHSTHNSGTSSITVMEISA